MHYHCCSTTVNVAAGGFNQRRALPLDLILIVSHQTVFSNVSGKLFEQNVSSFQTIVLRKKRHTLYETYQPDVDATNQDCHIRFLTTNDEHRLR